jgi:hypothetical protein
MKPVRIASALLAILLVVGVIVVVSSQTNLLVTTRTDRFTTTAISFVTVTSILNHTTTLSIYGNVELPGNCTAVSYFSPDTVSSGATTATTDTISSTNYSTFIHVNATASYAITATSYDLNDFPSEGWTVTVCTYQP